VQTTQNWEAEELSNIANQFAQFFNGDVVEMDDDLDLEI
jgi:DNA polymerase-3 subunit gamma/tau